MKQSNEPRAETSPKKQGDNSPDLIVYSVQSRGEDKDAIWTRLGAGWRHKDGNGFDLRCQALPVDGRLTLRFQDKAKAGTQDQHEHDAPTPGSR